MKITPSYEEIQKLKQSGQYDLVPLSCEILSDCCTPIEAMKILKSVSSHCFLLESINDPQTWGRYTFLGYNPLMEITCADDTLFINDKPHPLNGTSPLPALRNLLSEYRSCRLEGLPPFTGGLVGYFSYDFIGYVEPTARCEVEDGDAFKDLDLMLFNKIIAFDNLRQKITLIDNVPIDLNEQQYEAACKTLESMARLLHSKDAPNPPAGKLLSKPEALFSKEQYCSMVKKARHHIYEGDIFQIVLSNRIGADFEGSLFNTYRILRTLNPSPYMFYFSGTDVEVAGASPETLVKLEDGILHTFPLAGTRPRGKSQAEDLTLEKELLADEKELAEHNMLVDLGRNDLGKVSKYGSIQVARLHQILRFSHVMHIGSEVVGEIADDKDALDAIAAVLPAGTLSGAPKIRACQLIGELENNKRGIYGGAIGYIDFTGNMDTCIAIRIAYQKNGKVYVRSGAGIVADSVPEKEYQECLNKAGAVLDALQQAQEIES